MHVVEAQLAGNGFVQGPVKIAGVEVEPGHYRLIVLDAVDTQPVVIVEDDFEPAVVRQINAQWFTEATQGEAHVVITDRLDGLGHDAQWRDAVDAKIHDVIPARYL